MPGKSRPSRRLARDQNLDPTARRSPAPLRLLDVGTAGQMRLIEGESNGKTYIALSHRWSPRAALVRTTGQNVEDRKEQMDLISLPQTFQDAVTTTQNLGVRYLWIDSLCIVQDNPHEITLECSRMELIFSQAYSVIAATSGYSVQNGFLSRHGMDDTPFWLPEIGEVTYLRVRTTNANFRRDVLEENLHTRGWVFQERALARHTIHFATPQAYWECEDSIIGESGTDTSDNEDSLSSSDFPPDRAIVTEGGFVQTVKKVFRQYSSLNLSNDEDRPTAILALEYRLACRGQCVSLYGILGAEHLQETLVWKRRNAAMQPRIPFRRTRQVVPSWSWMHRMGEIEYVEFRQGLKSSINFSYEASPPLNGETGAIDAPRHYQLLGKLHSTQQEISLRAFHPSSAWARAFLDDRFTGLVSFDEDIMTSTSPSKFPECMVVWSGHGSIPQDAEPVADAGVRHLDIVLLVERIKEGERYYRRIGVAILDKDLVQLVERGDIRMI